MQYSQQTYSENLSNPSNVFKSLKLSRIISAQTLVLYAYEFLTNISLQKFTPIHAASKKLEVVSRCNSRRLCRVNAQRKWLATKYKIRYTYVWCTFIHVHSWTLTLSENEVVEWTADPVVIMKLFLFLKLVSSMPCRRYFVNTKPIPSVSFSSSSRLAAYQTFFYFQHVRTDLFLLSKTNACTVIELYNVILFVCSWNQMLVAYPMLLAVFLFFCAVMCAFYASIICQACNFLDWVISNRGRNIYQFIYL